MVLSTTLPSGDSNTDELLSTATEDRLAILSIPKAGTYLLSEIARNFGWHQTYWNVREDSMEDYSAGSMEDRRFNPEQFRREQGIVESAFFLPPRSFFVGHIECSEAARVALRSFRKVLAVRELPAALISRLRWERWHKRHEKFAHIWDLKTDAAQMEEFLRRECFAALFHIRDIIPWLDEPDVTVVRFEDMQQPDQRIVDQLGKVLELDRVADLAFFREALAADTITKSPDAADFADYWSDKAEEVFTILGGLELNKRLGYQ